MEVDALCRRPPRARRRGSVAAEARRHGPAERRRDRQRAPLGLRNGLRRAARGRDAGAQVEGRPDPARSRPAAAGVVDGAARPRPRRRPAPRTALPPRRAAAALRLRRAPWPARARGRDPDDRADHPLALPRPHVAPARRRAPRDRGGRGRLARSDVVGRGAAVAVLGPLRNQLRRARDPRDGGLRPPRAALPRPHAHGSARRGLLDRRLDGALEGGSASLRPAPRLPPARVWRCSAPTTREPQLADTQIALRAVASVLRREL